MRLTGKHIIITSNEAWGDVWYSKHNYAYELSKQNEVLFIDPPERWTPRNLGRPEIGIRNISESLRVLSYTNSLPGAFDQSFRCNNTIVSNAIRKRLKAEGWPVDLFLSFDPARLYDPALFEAGTSLFIAVDDYDLTMRGERLLFSKVDHIITISERFNAVFKPFKEPILTIGHAISSEEFDAPDPDINVTDYGLYVGTIDTRVELATIERMVQDNPTVPFVFIGRFALQGVALAEALFLHGKYANLHYLGIKPFKELKSYIKGSRFCLAPMDVLRPGNAISHHKVFQYLAFGKPVFSTVFHEYRSIAHLLYMHNDREELLRFLADFLANGESTSLRDERIAFARTCTYGSLFERIGQAIPSS
ncbi:MAG: hypothetical protein IPH05_07890 [Flavobacteriales bacterium]|jgi:hypothetical protein|nr:hypothetical protein [Flavobacteriales bacterium]MBK6551451.1 hypothetical protein [Flavobacteriales bacterium]MBK6882850.1 hypothetical protein [Flavobacteriales bacterium]MBK7101843.1 hypothetical protein [Flavobacteriales bacterium]MBK7114191.1 hypothetical protein [Flavobacteriales bacterium]